MNHQKFKDGWNDPNSFVFGNENFKGYYTPGKFEIKWPEDMNPEEMEKKVKEKIKESQKMGREFIHQHLEEAHNIKKEKLQPLSIRVKPHTKKFLKKESKLSAREILELYENFNNKSEIYINSLIEEEKELKKELKRLQEKIKNAKAFSQTLDEENQKD